MTAVAGTVFIAAGAFWLSFTSLADLARRSGIDPREAWAWPLIVDGIIVVATVAVVALGGSRAAWYPWALLVGGALVSVTANALRAVVAADATVPGGLAACVAAVPPIVLLAITHLTVVLTRTATIEKPDTESADPPVTEAAPLVAPGGELPATGSQKPAAVPASVLDRRGRAVELRGLGWSNKKIAREIAVHPSTVGRWFADAHLSDVPELSSVRELSSAEETTS
ncbi:MAG: DUF2637 domain-containing protein [Nocardioides sp.]|uniref:DUF2637 domain-containing protein n=1 Tax=Nocardioides sp. TaxID=35761 RepID=UPI0039E263ED